MPKPRTKSPGKKEKKHAPSTATRSTKRNAASMQKGALVIGGGISGIQAALDMADAGFQTYIVERSTSIGGRMAQLDKTFPTNDCSMCILSPKLVSAARHPNIELFTNSEVTSVSGSAGNFKVKIIKYPRFIDENKCVGCGECATKCPTKVPNEFDLGLGHRKAIYVPFPQAVPLVYAIDQEHCRFLQKGKCGICAKICKAEAVDYDQESEELTLDIGAIIVATGYEQFDPSGLEELGYRRYQNVITGMEFERLLNAAGPTQGKIILGSDGKQPKRILFVQCVGSRDIHRAEEFCSRICCMYAVKEAVIAKEHQPDLSEITILGMEIRAYGKGFEEYFQRAKSDGIKYVKGRVAQIEEDLKTGELLVRAEDVINDRIQDIKTDLVVLSSAVLPNKTNDKLSKTLDIQLDSHGFFQERPLPCTASESTRTGIFLSGCAQGPKDIPDSVAQGSAAAAMAGKYLDKSCVKITLPISSELALSKIEQKGEKLGEELIEPRIGVFVCHCGINIAGVLDVPALVKYTKRLPDVVFTADNLYTCSDDAQRYIQEMITEHNLTRVVVASCTPRTHEPIFKDTCARAGLNPYLFEMTNIRDQCSWVHMNEPEDATEKAKDLIRMAVARAKELKPLETVSTHIEQSAIVIGGGIAGMQCALDLASQKIKTILVEPEQQLGGRLRHLNKLAYTQKTPEELINEKFEQLQRTGVKIYSGYRLVDIKGYVGNFDITIEPTGPGAVKKKDKSKSKKGTGATARHTDQIQLNTGAIVLAIGADLYKPELKNEFGYNKYPNVITNFELEKRLKENGTKKLPKNITLIQCVGARQNDLEDGNPGCSRYCCQTALHQARELASAGVNVTILHRGIRAFSKYAEELYYETSQLGVRFIQYPDDKDKAPKITNKGAKIKVYDISFSQEVEFPADLIVLTLGMIPGAKETKELQNWLKIPLSADGFFLELHPKLAPVETNTTGIYLCGCAQGPKDITDTLAQASAAAAKVAALVSNDELAGEPITANVDEQVCWGCGTCEDVCVFGAVHVEDTKDGLKVSRVNTALCKGCGVCASMCPSGAMSIEHFTNSQISCMIKAFGEVTD